MRRNCRRRNRRTSRRSAASCTRRPGRQEDRDERGGDQQQQRADDRPVPAAEGRDREGVRAAAGRRRPGWAARSAGTFRPDRSRSRGRGTARSPTTGSRRRTRCARRPPSRSGSSWRSSRRSPSRRPGPPAASRRSSSCCAACSGRPSTGTERDCGGCDGGAHAVSSLCVMAGSCSGTGRSDQSLVATCRTISPASSTSTCQLASGSWPVVEHPVAARRRSCAAGTARSIRRSGRPRSARPCAGTRADTACTAPLRSRKTATCWPSTPNARPSPIGIWSIGPSRTAVVPRLADDGGHRTGTCGRTSSGREVRNWPGVAGAAPSCQGSL